MKTHLQLMPISERRKNLVRRCLRQWATVWAIGAGLMLVAYLTQRSTYHNEWRALTKNKRRAAPITKRLAEIKNMEARLTELCQHELIQLGLENERPVIPLLAVVSKSGLECQGKLQLDKFSLYRELRTDEQTEAPTYGGLTLEGTAVDNLVVARFVSLLRDTGLFQRVELKSSAATRKDDNPLQSYIVDCHF